MSKKPTKKDLEVTLRKKDKHLQELENTISDMVKMREHISKDMQDQLFRMRNKQESTKVEIDKHKKDNDKIRENVVLWKSAYYDLKDRTVDLEHRLEAVREMLTNNMIVLPKDTEEKEEFVDSTFSKLLRQLVKLENKVFMSATDAVESAVAKLTTSEGPFKRVWNVISPASFS